MIFGVHTGELRALTADALVVPVYKGGEIDPVTKSADALAGGAIARAIATGEVTGKAYERTVFHLAPAAKGAPRAILAVGLGAQKDLDAVTVGRYAGAAVRYLGKRAFAAVAVALPATASAGAKATATSAAERIAECAVAATFDTTTHRSKPPEDIVATSRIVLCAPGGDEPALLAALGRGRVIGDGVNLARLLSNAPPSELTPETMAASAITMAKQVGLSCAVLDPKQMQTLGMGAILAVGQGSVHPPRMIVLTYKGDPTSKETLALVGKGITFDSGGISLKPGDRMDEMKMDMSGGAAVIGAMAAIGTLKPKVNVVGVVAAAENLPSGTAYRPGDVLRAMNGKTIEVLNTDAEGRLVLADALSYAVAKLGATKIVDAATLTGACVVALGHAAAAAMTNDDAWVKTVLEAAANTGERYWQMPLFDDYLTQIRSEIADLKNTGGRAGGALTAGAFLKEFAGGVPWVHLDIAGTAYTESESAYQAKGPAGVPVRAFVAIAERLAGGAGQPGAKAKAWLKTSPIEPERHAPAFFGETPVRRSSARRTTARGTTHRRR
ncbi:MAG TPA: leucyl aminopeptidase [Candidatus Dormibacteraeota bacterium]|nr:leucyl aminopeptidase [Candidatus Dormibacteraeota bacterium]